MEVKPNDSVVDAIGAMYSGGAAGAVIIDEVQSSFGKYVDRDIGFVHFSTLVLWALEVIPPDTTYYATVCHYNDVHCS